MVSGKLNCFLTRPRLIGTEDKDVGGESDEDNFADDVLLYAGGLRVGPREIGQITQVDRSKGQSNSAQLVHTDNVREFEIGQL